MAIIMGLGHYFTYFWGLGRSFEVDSRSFYEKTLSEKQSRLLATNFGATAFPTFGYDTPCILKTSLWIPMMSLHTPPRYVSLYAHRISPDTPKLCRAHSQAGVWGSQSHGFLPRMGWSLLHSLESWNKPGQQHVSYSLNSRKGG